MFKVPEWGNDIPKSNVEVSNLFTKNKKNKAELSSPKIKVNGLNKGKAKNNRNNVNGIGKAKNKRVQRGNKQPKLTKDDHIKNRMMKRNLKNSETIAVEANTVNHSKQKLKNGINTNDISSTIKHKVLKRKGNLTKTNISNKSNNLKNLNNKSVHKKDSNGIPTNTESKQSRKRKRKANETASKDSNENIDIQNLNTDEPDRILVNAKRKKLNEKIKNEDVEDILFGNKVSIENNNTKQKNQLKNDSAGLSCNLGTDKLNQQPQSNRGNKIQQKKEKIKNMLQDSNRSPITNSSDRLRLRMMERLKAAQFRYLNEKLYTSSGTESQELFKSDPVAFQTYHEGYQQQVKKWPVNPLDLIVKRIQKMPKTHLIADLGCGEAALSKRVPNKVRSFDLVATVEGVEVCNMAHTPLLTASMDVVVYCLALMGTDLTQYLLEASRVLKIGGHLLIAEVESRFENAETFSSDVQRLGFSLKKMDNTHKVFFFMEFTKVRDAPTKKNKLPVLSLKPCFYKKR